MISYGSGSGSGATKGPPSIPIDAFHCTSGNSCRSAATGRPMSQAVSQTSTCRADAINGTPRSRSALMSNPPYAVWMARL